LLRQREQLRTVVEGFDAIYKGLPEERRAYEQGGIVKAEAGLMEHERQADLAGIAAEQVTGLVQEIEDRLFGLLASGREPPPGLVSEHAWAVERQKRLRAGADELRAGRDATADTVARGSGEPAPPAPAPVPVPAGAVPEGAGTSAPRLPSGPSRPATPA